MPNTTQQNNALAKRLQDSNSQFSALIDSAMRDVPQHVTRSGKRAIVVLSEQDFDDLQSNAASRLQAPAGFIEHLLSMQKPPAAWLLTRLVTNALLPKQYFQAKPDLDSYLDFPIQQVRLAEVKC